MESNSIDFKYVVDNTNNRVAFFESDEKLVDVLFSFLTMPMGTIVRLTSNRSPWRSIGCMNNLYRSVEILDERYLRTEACKTMLLNPQNGAVAQCNNLKLAIDDGASLRYFLCEQRRTCALSDYKLLSLYPNAICGCGTRMTYPLKLIKKEKHTGVAFDDKKEGVFVKGPIALTISDELRVMTSSSSASLSLFSKLGIKDTSNITEGTSSIGKFEALKLLECLLVSKTPLTEALLDKNLVPGSINMEEVEHDVSFRKNEVEEAATNDDEKIYVKLMVSKSKKVVCFAEASERFVDLLFSFLTVPLGFIAKEMQKHGSKGCINHLYDSIQDLDARQHLASTETTAMLVSPKLAPGFSYIGQLLNIEEYSSQSCYLTDKLQLWDSKASTHGEKITNSALTLMDPKSNLKDKYSGGGFLKGPAMFTITDDLIITPSSSVTGLSALRNLEVPFSDIEERIVYVGKGEASRLLVASFVTEAAITNTFLLSETKPGF